MQPVDISHTGGRFDLLLQRHLHYKEAEMQKFEMWMRWQPQAGFEHDESEKLKIRSIARLLTGTASSEEI